MATKQQNPLNQQNWCETLTTPETDEKGENCNLTKENYCE